MRNLPTHRVIGIPMALTEHKQHFEPYRVCSSEKIGHRMNTSIKKILTDPNVFILLRHSEKFREM